MGMSSCSKVDAFRCVMITKDEQGLSRPLEQWYWYCYNQKTGDEKSIWLKDSEKCIRDPSQDCKWIGTDILEEKIIKDEFEKQCQKTKQP